MAWKNLSRQNKKVTSTVLSETYLFDWKYVAFCIQVTSENIKYSKIGLKLQDVLPLFLSSKSQDKSSNCHQTTATKNLPLLQYLKHVSQNHFRKIIVYNKNLINMYIVIINRIMSSDKCLVSSTDRQTCYDNKFVFRLVILTHHRTTN